MSDLNFVVLTGVATRSANLRHNASGQSKSEFSLEVERPFERPTGGKVTDLFLVDVWGDLAEECVSQVKRGTKLLVVGTIMKDIVTGREGERQHLTKIKAKQIRVIEEKSSLRKGIQSPFVKEDFWSDEALKEYLDLISQALK